MKFSTSPRQMKMREGETPDEPLGLQFGTPSWMKMATLGAQPFLAADTALAAYPI
jgi:hypothetical protein